MSGRFRAPTCTDKVLARATRLFASVLADGAGKISKLFFGAKEAAISVALTWVKLRRVQTIGVADTEKRELVWRSDRGPLKLPYLGMTLRGRGSSR